ncbi:UPF0481 protein At3g47200-like [Telopea speciosissima]|uniref:UPF0481 protein At3g47200-like n=1 Tax=Telopea speciosissima TaxID=54955 RepID=UPI001CC731A0|nr:UPF0481 protein At3g47200-like [Telopea speciosissima]
MTSSVNIVERSSSTSSSSSSSISISHHHQQQPEWLLSILAETNQQETLLGESQRKPRIYKVPSILRDIQTHADSFDPMVVSFGPYHHGNPKLAMIEDLKVTIAKQLVSGRNLQEFSNFDEVARDAREYYDKELTDRFSEEDFRRMMFLDGCLLLYSIDCIMNPTEEDSRIKNNQMAFISRDILLLENQLPYIVLHTLMSYNIPREHKGENLVHKFIKRSRSNQHLSLPPPSSWENLQDQPPHLLHLLREELVGTVPTHPHEPINPLDEFNDWHSFRSVSELRAGGIECKKSGSSSLKDVSFNPQSFHGDLSLPPIVVDDNTKSMFLNLVAYEASPDFTNDYAVTSYICFMDALIDHAEDVKLLRSKEILLNLLGSDEKVADLFNDLATNLVPNPNEYRDVKGNIEKYYKKKSVIWITEMLETHFRSPWTALGFLVALVIILLTFVQSYFSIFPRGGGGGDQQRSRTPARKIPYNN